MFEVLDLLPANQSEASLIARYIGWAKCVSPAADQTPVGVTNKVPSVKPLPSVAINLHKVL